VAAIAELEEIATLSDVAVMKRLQAAARCDSPLG
jgi:hypothetical protein